MDTQRFCFAAHERPDKGVKTAELLLHSYKCTGIGDSALYFQSIAYDTRVEKQRGYFSIREPGDFCCIKFRKGRAIVFALVEDGRPGKARLRAFENQELEQNAIIMDGNAPFMIVVIGIDLA